MWFSCFNLQRKLREPVGGPFLQECCHIRRGFLLDLLKVEAACAIAKGRVLESAPRRRNEVLLEELKVNVPVGAIVRS